MISTLHDVLRDAVCDLRELGRHVQSGGSAPNLAEQIWDQCDVIAHALQHEGDPVVPLRDDDMCDTHRPQGGDTDCPECFKANYEGIGRALLETIHRRMPTYTYLESPVEVVGDLLQEIEDLTGGKGDPVVPPPAEPRSDLLPCPFCGGPAVLTDVRMSGHSFKVGCYNECCWRPGTDAFDNAHHARAAWNVRRMNPLLRSCLLRPRLRSID
ncbi:MAG TPA: Lar family restriction alleviation protein [Gemmatimonadales bacterium]|nr:Lar family restriction alleviation protein [Gemmatimonadales bacterium]